MRVDLAITLGAGLLELVGTYVAGRHHGNGGKLAGTPPFQMTPSRTT